MQDPPGLDVGNGSFELVADLVDCFVVGPVAGVEGQIAERLFMAIEPSPM